jgi:hypothetical protein
VQTALFRRSVDTTGLVTPTTAYYTTASSAASSPGTTTVEHPPLLPYFPSSSPPAPASQPLTHSQSQSPHLLPIAVPMTAIPSLSHPPSPTLAQKRLSFMAYSDLLASTPVSLQPLSSFTTSASTAEPPPHIPSLSGFHHHPHQHYHGTTHTTTSSSAGSIHHWGPGEGGGPGSMELVERERDSMALLGDVGGEWDRGGFSGSLEERLETALGALPAVAHTAEATSMS